jgi:hypothetical protein
MTSSQDNRLRLFAANVQDIKGEFVWQSPMIKHLAALLYAIKDKAVDNEAIRQSYEMLKANTGLFSMFRGNSALNIASMLSLSSSGETLLREVLEVYDLLKATGFWASDYLVVAAYQIASTAGPEGCQPAVAKTKALYDGMKAYHPLLTSSDDYIFATMLGLSDVEISAGLARMEKLFRMLKGSFFSGNGVQALAQVLVLSDQPDAAIKRILALRQALRYAGLKMESQYTMSVLGVLTLLPGTPEAIVCDLVETFEFLRGQKGFSAWSFSKQELELYAAALTVTDYAAAVEDGLVTTALSTSITNILIAQQSAVAAAAAASAASAAN